MITHTRRSALSLTILGSFVLLAVFNPGAGAHLPRAIDLANNAADLVATATEAAQSPQVVSPNIDAPLIVTVESGDTLMSLLQQQGIGAGQAQNAIDALKRQWDPRELRIGQELLMRLDQSGIKEIRLSPAIDHEVVLARGENGSFGASAEARNLIHVPVRVAGTIHSSLFEAATAAGLPQSVLSDVIHAFSYDVDFQREVQPGDQFEVMFDQMVEDKSGKVMGTGNIAVASLILSGKPITLYRYAPAGGLPDFYTPTGSSVKKALLRTPVDGARISSSFGQRHHPILGYTRMHQGVDFAVPSGTPIYASGDATVASAGWSNGYGNMVVLRHQGGYSTAYGHMSRIASGMKPGTHVRQGAVIGFVGMTGLATGPHLHYEVRINDKPTNPLSVHMPPGQKLEGREFTLFQKQQQSVDQRLASIRTNKPVASN